MNKFEQVSSDDRQMLLTGGMSGGGGVKVPSLVSGGWGLYSEVQCIVGNGHLRPSS